MDNVRASIRAFFARHFLMWEAFMAGLAILYVVVTVLDATRLNVPGWVLNALAAMFAVEFLVRFWAADQRRQYLRSHWIDAATAIPIVGSFRVLRLVRLARVLRSAKAAMGMERFKDHDRTSLSFLGPVLLGIWVVAALALFVTEFADQPPREGFVHAMQMAFFSMTTFGLGGADPTTAEGGIVAGLLIFVSIGLVSFVSGELTRRFLRDGNTNQLIEERTAEIRRELQDLRALLEGTLLAPETSAEEVELDVVLVG